MLQTARAIRGMIVAPHNLAAQAGLGVLREGGTAAEVIVTAAAAKANFVKSRRRISFLHCPNETLAKQATCHGMPAIECAGE